jgi:hypothetical protein
MAYTSFPSVFLGLIRLNLSRSGIHPSTHNDDSFALFPALMRLGYDFARDQTQYTFTYLPFSAF